MHSLGNVLERKSMKDGLFIMHKGVPPAKPADFPTSCKTSSWSKGVDAVCNIIYDINDPSRCIQPPNSPNDRILRFNSKFESGNLREVRFFDESCYHLTLECDITENGPAQWFYFQISNTRKDTKYHFVIYGFNKKTNLFCNGSSVFWYSDKQYQTEGISWSRGGSSYYYGLERSKGLRSYVEFDIKFPYNNDTVYISYCLPYTYSELIRNIETWKSISKGSMKVETLCYSYKKRPCPKLTITSPRSGDGIRIKKKNIFLTARIHPGESNGSYVLHGLIDFLLSNNGCSRFLLDHFVFHIIPMLNIDGVIEGFYRASLTCNDLNRYWINPDPVEHPEVYYTKELMKNTNDIAMYIDFHGHARLHGTFAFGCPNDDTPELKDREKIFPRMLSFISNLFSWQNCIFSYPKDRQSTARVVVRTELNIVHSFTIETSFGGIEYGYRAGTLYDERSWKELGMRTAECMYHFYVGRNSPFFSHAAREFTFLNADREDELSTERRSVKKKTNERSVEWAPKVYPVRRNVQRPASNLRSRSTAGLVKLLKPNAFFNAPVSSIIDTQVSYNPPKFYQMEYINM